MPTQSVNYDSVADAYKLRYLQTYNPDGIAQKLLNIACQTQAEKILEIGCGTGHWIEILQNQSYVVGLDRSYGMLNKIDRNNGYFSLVQADSDSLPFDEDTFDFIFCVNSFHHFCNSVDFISNVQKHLKINGTLAIIGMNPHSGQDNWFVYDFFPNTLETDLERFSSTKQIMTWMSQAGYSNIQNHLAEQLNKTLTAEEVLALPKEYTSQLSLLSDQEYEAGLNRIRKAVSHDTKQHFNVDISLIMVTAEKCS